MKLYTAIFTQALLVSNVAAFSAVVPNTPSTTAATNAGPSMEPIDKTMQGIDAEGTFDPTAGESPALKRNNKDEIWVDQVWLILCVKIFGALFFDKRECIFVR